MTLPRVQPITPTWHKEPFDDPDWLFDFKYDGFRALYYIEPGHNRLISRNGNLLTRFDVLAGALAAELNVDDAIIDGEVIAADETGRPQFYDLLRSTRAPVYVAFDIVWLNGADLRSLPLHERRRALQTILPKGSPIVSEALSVTHRGSELFELMCANSTRRYRTRHRPAPACRGGDRKTAVCRFRRQRSPRRQLSHRRR